IVLLDASLSFENIWPTPAIWWKGALSIELAACLLLLAAAVRLAGRPSRRLLRWLTVAWLVLVVGHYVDVTTPALYGREVNLYWDLRFIPDVAGMVTHVTRPWLVLGVVLGASLVVIALYALLRWSWGRV